MSTGTKGSQQSLPNGVMLNAYPDSIGRRLSDTVALLQRPELEKTFALFYILPTFFNSDLDRGFSVIDYDHNPDLVSREDLEELSRLEINFKFDLVLNHLSVRSPQFQDLLQHGDGSEYRDFFIDWNAFWAEHGEPTEDGHLMPKPEYLEKLFMRKPGAPILKVRFPDGSERPYWNTFYQEIRYQEVAPADLRDIDGLSDGDAEMLAGMVNAAIREKADLSALDLNGYASLKDRVISIVEQKRDYLGQMDLNARSEKVWHFYDETLRKLRDYGAKIIRLDAFAYLHKEPGEVNFFNRPGTWSYLDRLRGLAEKYDLIVFPEIHAEYGSGLHEEVAGKGFPIYDFFFPGLVIDALERGASDHLLHWIGEIQAKSIQTINMLGCHDGIPVLDLGGKQINGTARSGLLDEAHVEAVMSRIIERGGRVKSLYGPDGKKISYYQVNATFFSALGEDERKLLLARAIQLFMPGIPQVWYLDLFAGKNDYAAADRGGPAGHKEINRTNLSLEQVEECLQKPVVQDQLKLIRLRNTSPAFQGRLEIIPSEAHLLHLSWSHDDHRATLRADLRDHSFSVEHLTPSGLQDRFVFD
ncbi:glycosidase [Thiorhodococcus mannitoliphagus]|uniref:Glycosidase n=1 Tax=Thiorhodococcus mannitoliphagus TaxID=329406 RepID=A0A6P1DV50_9GAMM|nr:glycosidase [Thiorhodococcus mannitoliphagus]NEX21978.1 glycosidase [Thiorhodococcus mannitoliphagus]